MKRQHPMTKQHRVSRHHMVRRQCLGQALSWHTCHMPTECGACFFFFDKKKPFDTIPTGQAYAFLEWGMNWCVSLHANEYLKLHAAAVSREDATIIMPGVPGSGKSTLCAALGLNGWRILYICDLAHIMILVSQIIPLSDSASQSALGI